MENIRQAEEHSHSKVLALRTSLANKVDSSKFGVVTTGSYARQDASDLSDLDYLLINYAVASDEECASIHSVVRSLICDLGIREPSPGGAFGNTVTISGLTTNIGGQSDTNDGLTCRMLVLLECDYLVGKDILKECRDKIIRHYVNDHINPRNMIRFFLNDLIRYHKTMGVDFEFKTNVGGKSWGIRNIKLQFSRKLIYFSGILVVAETADKQPSEKREIARTLFEMTPRERILNLCGDKSNDVFELYDGFLARMRDVKFREMADAVTIDRETHCDDFRKAKTDGHSFSNELYKLLYATYPEAHPIHQALVL